MEPSDVIRLMIATGAIDTRTGAVNVDKLRGRWSIEDRGRRGVKITRSKGAGDVGADYNQGGAGREHGRGNEGRR